MFGKLEFTAVNSDFPFPLNSTHAHLDSKLYFSNGEAFLNSYPLCFVVKAMQQGFLLFPKNEFFYKG